MDIWTKGIWNFAPLAQRLRSRGVESLLVHRGSWGNDLGRPKEETIDGVLCRDTTFYGTRFLYNVLRWESPHVVLLLDSTNFADRAIILAARALGIQSCFLAHGSPPIAEADDLVKEMEGEGLRRKRWQRVGKYLRWTLPNYFYSGFRQSASFPFRLSPYRAVWDAFHRPYMITHPRPSPELQCDRALVWGNVHRAHFAKLCGYSCDRMRVVGHPPLDEVFAYKNSPPSQCECNLLRGELDIPERTPFTVYLEDALVELGNPNWTSDERIRHLQELAGICGEAGRLLIVKLHPLTPAKPIQDALAGHPAARIVQKTNLPLLVYLAESAIGHISTTVNIPICLGKPVLSTRWGYTERAPDCFGKEGVVAVCNTAAELRHAIQDPSNAYRSHGDRLRKYIDDFITHTDGRSRDRIVESLLEQASLCCQGSTPRMPQRASAA